MASANCRNFGAIIAFMVAELLVWVAVGPFIGWSEAHGGTCVSDCLGTGRKDCPVVGCPLQHDDCEASGGEYGTCIDVEPEFSECDPDFGCGLPMTECYCETVTE
jgi:hypothetical protein